MTTLAGGTRLAGNQLGRRTACFFWNVVVSIVVVPDRHSTDKLTDVSFAIWVMLSGRRCLVEALDEEEEDGAFRFNAAVALRLAVAPIFLLFCFSFSRMSAPPTTTPPAASAAAACENHSRRERLFAGNVVGSCRRRAVLAGGEVSTARDGGASEAIIKGVVMLLYGLLVGVDDADE